MALTREVGSAQLLVTTIELTTASPWEQVCSSDIERRGGCLYVDPTAPGPAWLAHSEQHARTGSSGAPFYPDVTPRGFELETAGGVWVYAEPSDLARGVIVVYFVAEVGQATDLPT